MPKHKASFGNNTRITEILPHLQHLTPYEIDQAPHSVGIYAWYSKFDAGPRDWKMEVATDDGRDLGIERTMSTVARHSARFFTPPLNVEVDGRLLERWKGRLTSVASERMRAKLATDSESDSSNGDGSDGNGAGALRKVVARPRLRGELVRLLSTTSPLFTAPLYIGVSDNLHRRLGSHVRDLERFTHAVERDPDAQSRLQEADLNFAMRAAGAGFRPGALEVWTLNLETLADDVPPDELRVLIEAVEWLLNRWHKPQLGRR